jgi:hypothetical protein
MYIEVIKGFVPNLGEKGTRREIPDNEGRVHLVLGNVKIADPQEPKITIKRRRRVYRRRDMVAET